MRRIDARRKNASAFRLPVCFARVRRPNESRATVPISQLHGLSLAMFQISSIQSTSVQRPQRQALGGRLHEKAVSATKSGSGQLEAFLDEYIRTAGIRRRRIEPSLRSTGRRTGVLSWHRRLPWRTIVA
jgi:hypothetical protein